MSDAPQRPAELMRASDAERESTVTRLRDAAAEGRLSFEELADRTGAAAEAVTRRELATLIRDLPAPARDEVVVAMRRSSCFGDVRQAGRWKVPASSRWESLFGDIVIDLREAQVTSQVVTIDAGTVFGDIDLLVPEGVAVEVRSRLVFGDVIQKAGEVAPPGSPLVILTGGTVFGDVRVRAQRLRERLAQRLSRGS